MAAANKQKNTIKIEVPEMEREFFTIDIEGTSPLLTHKWSDRAKETILAKQLKKANKGREIRDPIRDFLESIYFLNGNIPTEIYKILTEQGREINSDVADIFADVSVGIPAAAFKNAAVGACRCVDGLTMVMARGAFFIKEDSAGNVKIDYERLTIREDTVRVGKGSSDLRYRACFYDWSARLTIECNPLAMSKEQVINLVDISGFASGVGDWRPENNGSYGMYRIKRQHN